MEPVSQPKYSLSEPLTAKTLAHNEPGGIKLTDAQVFLKYHDYLAAMRVYILLIDEAGMDLTENALSLLRDIKDSCALKKVVQFCIEAGSSKQASPAIWDILGLMYRVGCGVEQNHFTAFDYFKKAADGGLAVGLRHLGYMFANGCGVEKDFAQAHDYFEQADEKGDVAACVLNADLYMGEKQYSKAFELNKKAADNGNGNAKTRLGVMYERGCGTNLDLFKALAYYKEAAEQEESKAKAHELILTMCLNGKAIKVDSEYAIQILKMAAYSGNKAAIDKLAEICLFAFTRTKGEPALKKRRLEP